MTRQMIPRLKSTTIRPDAVRKSMRSTVDVAFACTILRFTAYESTNSFDCPSDNLGIFRQFLPGLPQAVCEKFNPAVSWKSFSTKYKRRPTIPGSSLKKRNIDRSRPQTAILNTDLPAARSGTQDSASLSDTCVECLCAAPGTLRTVPGSGTVAIGCPLVPDRPKTRQLQLETQR